MPIASVRLPPRIETARLVLRSYVAADVEALDGDAIRSIDHIGRFMPNARAELLGDRAALIADARSAFDAGERFAYGMFLPDGSFVGNCGARLTDDRELNIGYWVLIEHLRKGYASEAVRAVTAAGFAAGVRRFVLNCNPSNAASIGVARSTGFTYLSTDEHVERERRRVPRDDLGAAADRAVNALTTPARNGVSSRRPKPRSPVRYCRNQIQK